MPNGFINVVKAPGITSHDIVSHLRKVYGMKKIGHAGTLDPAAAGVLPIALGKATRMLEYMDNADKSYKVELTLGFSTDTGDDTGEVLSKQDFELPSRETIETVLTEFTGKIKQRPPIYSAVRINGEKAYKLARKNINIEMPEREIEIFNIKLQELTSTGFIFHVVCSKGTYIRSLCMDIGEKLGIPAVMSFLIRTHVGSFKLEDSYTTEEIGLLSHQVLLPVDYPLVDMAKYMLNHEETIAFKQGKKIFVNGLSEDDKFMRIYAGDEFAGIGKYDKEGQYIAPHKVLL